MRTIVKITPKKIELVKAAISRGLSLRNAANRAKVSYYTAWHISKGSYDNNEPLQTKKENLFFHY